MQLADIKDGCYVLSQPIKNPHPDRRIRDWRYRPEIGPGRFIVRTIEKTEIIEGITFKDRSIIISQHEVGLLSVNLFFWSESKVSITSQHEDLAVTLAENWTRDDSLKGALIHAEAAHYVHPQDVVIALVESGAVPEQIVLTTIEKLAELAEENE